MGSSVTITAPAAEGYNFVGWYDGETLKCSTNTYTFTITADTELTAVYEGLGSASLKIDGGKSFSINGDAKTTAITANYTLGTTVTVITNDADFAYWENSYGMVLSRSATYTFTVTGADTITAVFDTPAEKKATLVYESYYGQIMAREQLASGGSMSIPSLPYRNGYSAVGWDFNGDGEYDGQTDTLAAAITAGLATESKVWKILPIYELKTATYEITVVNGTGSGTYNQNDVVTATPTIPDGKKFSHWTDGTNILSYNETYKFFAEKNITVTAVFVDIAVEVEAVGATAIVNMYPDTANNKLIFVSMSTVPVGCTIKKAGVIATNDTTIGNDITKFNDTATGVRVRGNSWTGTSYQYTWTMPNVSAGETWYVGAYLVYTDTNGNSHTVYGAIVSQTL